MLGLRFCSELIGTEVLHSVKKGPPILPSPKFCISSLLTSAYKRPLDIYTVLHQPPFRDQVAGSSILAPVYLLLSSAEVPGSLETESFQGLIASRLSPLWLKNEFQSSPYACSRTCANNNNSYFQSTPIRGFLSSFSSCSFRSPCISSPRAREIVKEVKIGKTFTPGYGKHAQVVQLSVM